MTKIQHRGLVQWLKEWIYVRVILKVERSLKMPYFNNHIVPRRSHNSILSIKLYTRYKMFMRFDFLLFLAKIHIPYSPEKFEIIEDIPLIKAEKGAKMVLNNIFFDLYLFQLISSPINIFFN